MLSFFINTAQIKDKYEYYNITFRYIYKLLSLYIHIINKYYYLNIIINILKIFLTVTTTFLKILRNVKIKIILICHSVTLIINLFLNNYYIVIIINLAKIYHRYFQKIKSLIIIKKSFITNVIHLSRSVKIINGRVCHSVTISITLIKSFLKNYFIFSFNSFIYSFNKTNNTTMSNNKKRKLINSEELTHVIEKRDTNNTNVSTNKKNRIKEQTDEIKQLLKTTKNADLASKITNTLERKEQEQSDLILLNFLEQK